jgi:hypothetical protein
VYENVLTVPRKKTVKLNFISHSFFVFQLFFFSTIRSLSPGARSQRSHRPKLPSIDNDDWGEGNVNPGKSRSRGAISKRVNVSKRPPRGQKHNMRSHSFTKKPEQNISREKEWQPRSDSHLNTTQRIRNSNKNTHLDTTQRIRNSKKSADYSDSESGSGESCISSDFTRLVYCNLLKFNN